MKRMALDIETTGLDPNQGHKIVEIGCVELENNYPTGNCCNSILILIGKCKEALESMASLKSFYQISLFSLLLQINF